MWVCVCSRFAVTTTEAWSQNGKKRRERVCGWTVNVLQHSTVIPPMTSLSLNYFLFSSPMQPSLLTHTAIHVRSLQSFFQDLFWLKMHNPSLWKWWERHKGILYKLPNCKLMYYWWMKLWTETKQNVLTCHGAKPKELITVIVVGGTTPPHAVTPPVCGAVCVVTTTVEEGEVAQSPIGVPAQRRHDSWNQRQTSPFNAPI